MADQPDSSSLLQALNHLFSHVSLLDLEKRKQSYRSAPTPAGIGARLSQDIERMASNPAAMGATVAVNGHEHASNPDAPPASRGSVSVSASAEVVDHFKSRASSDVSPYLGDKMVRSTWDHLHHAVAHARAGDLANARLHAGIAGQAMQEAAHFMSEQAYDDFSGDIETALARLEGPPGHGSGE